MIVAVQMLIAVPFCDHVDRNGEPSSKLAGPEAIDAAMDTAPNADQEKNCTGTAPLEISPLMVDMRQIITLYILYSTAVRSGLVGDVCLFMFVSGSWLDQLPVRACVGV
jgi:hypothetical protein